MDSAVYSVCLDFERALRRDRPYDGYPRLPSEGSPQMAFFDAAFEGDHPRLRELASGRDAKGMAWLADVCLVGAGPFQTAARMGKLDAVRCMVEELGFDVNAGSQAGVTALAAAAADGRMHVMRYLLDKGADPNKAANSGHCPLHHAAKHGLFCADTKLSIFRLVYQLVAVQTRFEGVAHCSPEQSSTPH